MHLTYRQYELRHVPSPRYSRYELGHVARAALVYAIASGPRGPDAGMLHVCHDTRVYVAGLDRSGLWM